MSTYQSDDEQVPMDSDSFYDIRASQEEIYMEETEEEVSEVLEADIPVETTSVGCTRTDLDRERTADSEELNEAAEELISGDADDPPLTEEGAA